MSSGESDALFHTLTRHAAPMVVLAFASGPLIPWFHRVSGRKLAWLTDDDFETICQLVGMEWEDSSHFRPGDVRPAYPATIGVAWDETVVLVGGEPLPPGSDIGVIEVSDAAGNTTVQEIALLVDGNPPSVAVTAPAADAVLSSEVTVEVRAENPEDERVFVEIRLGCALVATVAGPEAAVVVDTSAFSPGPSFLTAVAGDRAGNLSAPAQVPVVVR